MAGDQRESHAVSPGRRRQRICLDTAQRFVAVEPAVGAETRSSPTHSAALRLSQTALSLPGAYAMQLASHERVARAVPSLATVFVCVRGV